MKGKNTLFNIICKNLYKKKRKLIKEQKYKDIEWEIDLIRLAKQEIMQYTNGDSDKISAVKAQASSGTTFDVVNSFIALLALVANSLSLLITLLNPAGEYQMLCIIIEAVFWGMLIYVTIGVWSWRYRMEWHMYVALATEQLLDEGKEKFANKVFDLLEEINNGLKEIAEQEQNTQDLLKTTINEEKKTRDSNKSAIERFLTRCRSIKW